MSDIARCVDTFARTGSTSGCCLVPLIVALGLRSGVGGPSGRSVSEHDRQSTWKLAASSGLHEPDRRGSTLRWFSGWCKHKYQPTSRKEKAVKKMLMIVIAAGALAIPVGATFAQNDTPDPTAPVPTCEDQDRIRDRDRVNEQDPAAVQGQERAQRQFQLHLGDGTGDCTLEFTGESIGDRAQDRDQVRLDDATGDQVQARSGEMTQGAMRRGN